MLLRYHAHMRWTFTFDLDFQSQASYDHEFGKPIVTFKLLSSPR